MKKIFLILLGWLFWPGMILAQVDLTVISEQTDELGLTHVRYAQYYKGVPVFGGQRLVHLNPDQSVRSTNGKISENLNLDVRPKLKEEEALTKAEELWPLSSYDKSEIKLYILDKNILNKKEEGVYLAWRVELSKDQPAGHEYYFLDAWTGELVYQITGMQSVVYRQVYDCSVNFWSGIPGNCYLDTSYLGYTYGRSEGQSARGVQPIYAYYGYNYEDTDDLYDYFGGLYNYYYIKFGRDGGNNYGGIGDGSATYPTANSVGVTFIDWYSEEYDACPNAYFNGANSVHFCAGYVVDDVTGHEFAHAVNYFSVLSEAGVASGLTYSGESGALNEANSDIFGEAFEYYYSGSSDWLSGSDLPDGPSRSLADPADYTYTGDSGSVPYPDRYNSENFYCGTSDNGGVHINSTVAGHAAYLMATGGTYNNCTITGLGRDKEEAIFYRAQTTYYTPSTDMNGAYSALLNACYDLYGLGSSDCKEAKKALKAVEMDQSGYCSGETGADPGCAAVDIPPTITNITSETVDGYYKAGSVIDIDLTFSEPVTGSATLTLNSGGNCVVSVDNSATASCDYSVAAGEDSDDLNVASLSGIITDGEGETFTVFAPTYNLSANKEIIVDTTKPKAPSKLKIYTSANKKNRIKTINPRTYTKVIKAKSQQPYFAWNEPEEINQYYVRFSYKNLERLGVKQNNYRQTKKSYRGVVGDPAKIYRLYMILKDAAGNISKLKILLRYKIET